MFPFKETIHNTHSIREFSSNTNEMDLIWHMDVEDRTIEPIGETHWLFQFDNQLPISIDSPIFIPKQTIHRVIKGPGSLTIKLTKHE
jgi:hypothetical protein